MWEFCVEASKKNADLIDYISKRIEDAVLVCGGVKSQLIVGNTCSLAVGCEKKHQKTMEGVLRTIVCDTICEKMKFKFLQSHIDLIVEDEKLFNAFIKVYTYFDAEIERKIVLRNLTLSNKIVLESFLEFRLQTLKKKWQEMCMLTNSSSNLFLKSETFLELLKFLISNLEIKVNTIVVNFGAECFIYEERDKNNLILLHKFSLLDDVGIITKIIEICPLKIKILTNTKPEIASLIAQLFENRVEIIK